MKIETTVCDNVVSVYHERKATKAEQKTDPSACIMAEWVHITFGKGEPKLVVNRNLCE